MTVLRPTTVVLAILALTTAAVGTVPDPLEYGCCPQTTPGWMLFEDSNRRTPDFWWLDSVVVQEVDVCPHGIHLFFVADEDEQPHYIALVLVKPTRRLYETRLTVKLGDPSIATRLECARPAYESMLQEIGELLGVDVSRGAHVVYDNTPSGARPVIVPSPSLIMKWRGNECRLRGYIDVYMTMFS